MAVAPSKLNFARKDVSGQTSRPGISVELQLGEGAATSRTSERGQLAWQLLLASERASRRGSGADKSLGPSWLAGWLVGSQRAGSSFSAGCSLGARAQQDQSRRAKLALDAPGGLRLRLASTR